MRVVFEQHAPIGATVRLKSALIKFAKSKTKTSNTGLENSIQADQEARDNKKSKPESYLSNQNKRNLRDKTNSKLFSP